jgi:hypothetical protein
MTTLTNALQQLREERNKAQLQIEKLDGAISAIEGLVKGTRVKRSIRRLPIRQ